MASFHVGELANTAARPLKHICCGESILQSNSIQYVPNNNVQTAGKSDFFFSNQIWMTECLHCYLSVVSRHHRPICMGCCGNTESSLTTYAGNAAFRHGSMRNRYPPSRPPNNHVSRRWADIVLSMRDCPRILSKIWHKYKMFHLRTNNSVCYLYYPNIKSHLNAERWTSTLTLSCECFHSRKTFEQTC